MNSKCLLVFPLLCSILLVSTTSRAGELVDLATGRRCPLEHSRVRGEVMGFVSSVELTQIFRNPFDTPIEAVYVFPLPHEAAVYGMEIVVGARRVRARIEKREEAAQIYREAREEGHLAALLEQERPNVFTQSVANILPGETVRVTLRYFEELAYAAGRFELVFPMAVGPRYIPETVADANRLQPPVVRPPTRAGHDVSLELTLHAASALGRVESPSHRIDVESLGGDRLWVKLRAGVDETIPNEDFVLRYALLGEGIEVLALPHRLPGEDGYVLLLVQPSTNLPVVDVPKEIVFVVDGSGSMHGEPIEKVREAMRFALERLRPEDSFQIVRFSDRAELLDSEPLPATPGNVIRGIEYVRTLSAGGGTILLEGVRAALSQARDPEKRSVVAFMTDGYIGNESEIFHYLEANRGRTRLFSFGVGSSVNRHLLDGMASVGGGTAEYVLLDETAEASVQRFYERLARPALTDVTIDWGDVEVFDIYPRPLPDLFADQPIVVYGRYVRGGRGRVVVRGRYGGMELEESIDLQLPDVAPSGLAIAKLWARNRIRVLSFREAFGGNLRDAITRTALEHALVSAYTAFVAVEERFVGEAASRVDVPVEIPAGVSYRHAVGGMSFTLIDVWSHRGTTARFVNLVLLLMAVASLSIIVERYLAFRRARPLVEIREAGLRALSSGAGRATTLRAMERSGRSSGFELSRGVGTLLTLGLAAPGVGALGAVVGLVNVFRALSLTATGGLGAVSAGIEEALVPLAYGLGVGLVSYSGYAYYRRRLARMKHAVGSTVMELARARPSPSA